MLSKKNKKYILSLDSNTDEFIRKYKKNCSTYAMIDKKYKRIYVLIFVTLIAMVLFLVFSNIICRILLAVTAIAFILLNYSYYKYAKNIISELNIKRHNFIKSFFKKYDCFTLKLVLEYIKNKLNVDNVMHLNLLLAICAVILIPFWDSYVSRFFEKNIIGLSSEFQLNSFILFLFICISLIAFVFSVRFLIKFFYSLYIAQMAYKVLINSLEIIAYEKEFAINENKAKKDDRKKGFC